MRPLRLPTLKLPEPLPHRPNLPQVRLLDELRLRVEVEDAVAVPVMARARDEILGMQVGGIAGRGVVGVVADVEPDVDVAVDKGQAVRGEVEIAVLVVVGQVGPGGGDGVELAGWKGPLAPLLRVVDLEDAGDQRRSCCRRDLVGALFGAGAVEVAARCRVGWVGVEGLVLGAVARGAVDRDTVTGREERLFHVLGVIAEVGPRFAVTVLTEHGVDRRDVLGGIQVSDVGAEVEKVLRSVRRIPIEFLPCVRRIVHWPPNWKRKCHRKILVMCQGLKAENGLEFLNRYSIVCSD